MEKDDIWDYVRVTNVRGEPEFQATLDEKVIIGHRGTGIFGNEHIMNSQTMAERNRVIIANKIDLDADLEIQGPKWQALDKIASEIVENEQKFAFLCFCAPLGCHLDAVIPIVVKMAQEKLAIKLSNNQQIMVDKPKNKL